MRISSTTAKKLDIDIAPTALVDRLFETPRAVARTKAVLAPY